MAANDKPPSAIRCCVRLRPDADSSAFDVDGCRLTVQREVLARAGRADWLADLQFTFADVFGAETSTAEVYERAVADVLPGVLLSGMHCTLMAYGQTSSGKTHTMLGDAAATTGPTSEPGLITLAIQDVLRQVGGDARGARRYRLRLSCLEVYNEQCNDLLAPERSNLKLFEKAGGVLVQGLSEYEFGMGALEEDLDALAVLLRAAERQRHVGATSANDRSSRSHLVCCLTVDSWEGGGGDESAACARQSTLQLVDLAGSERRQTSSGGDASQGVEGATINKSLLALSTIIHRLSDLARSELGVARSELGMAGSLLPLAHLPFRDSKLTRLLQPCLGGPAQALIVATVRPAAACLDESLATLRFGVRAQRVQNAPSNSPEAPQVSVQLLNRLSAEITSLRQQLMLAERNGGGGSVPPSPARSHSRSIPPSPRSVRNDSGRNDSGRNGRTSPAVTSVAAGSGSGAQLGAQLPPPPPHARPSPATFAAHEAPSPAGRHPFGRSGLSAASSSLLASLGVPGAVVGTIGDPTEFHSGVLPNAGGFENGRSGCGGGGGGGGGGANARGSAADTALEAAARDEEGWRVALAAVGVEPQLARGGAALMYLHALERAASLRCAAHSQAHELRRAVRIHNGAQNGAQDGAQNGAQNGASKSAKVGTGSPSRRRAGDGAAPSNGLARLPLAPPGSSTPNTARSPAAAEEAAEAADAALIAALEEQLVSLLEGTGDCVRELIGVLGRAHRASRPGAQDGATQAAVVAMRARAAALDGEMLPRPRSGVAEAPMLLDERVRMLRRSREELCGQHDMLCHLLQARSRRVREWE